MSNEIEEIKNRLDIVEVIGSYIRLSKAGRNYKALCPFHQEKTPSFIVSPEKQIWHCFGCGKGGDIFTFVMEIEHIDFYEALKTLAQRAGVELKKEPVEKKSRRQKFLAINELATEFFEAQLWRSQDGQKALGYLKKRGLEDGTIRKWRIGWAPNNWRALSDFLRKKYSVDDLVQVGLAISKSNRPTEIYDRFRSRIVFPIFNLDHQPVAFSGRIFNQDESQAKYINTPETILYQKGYQLMGLNFAHREIRQKDSCLLVEGNMDVIMAHQAGTENVVAPCGTGFTQGQAKIIHRYTENLIIAFDSDEAGQRATRRVIDLALEKGLNTFVVKISEKDPADLILENCQIWLKSVQERIPAIDFYFQSVITNSSLTIAGKKQIVKIILPTIKRISNQVEKAEWVKKLSQRININEKAIWQELKKIKEPRELQRRQATSLYSVSNPSKFDEEPLERRVILLFIFVSENGLNARAKMEQIKEEYFTSPIYKKMFQFIKKTSGSQSLINCFPPDLSSWVSRLLLEVDGLKNYSNKSLEEEVEDLIGRLKGKYLQREINLISQEINDLEKYQPKSVKINGKVELLSRLISQQKEIQERIFNRPVA